MINIGEYSAEIQSRADSVNSSTPASTVREISIAVRAVELAGGTIDRAVLDVELQRVADDVSGSSTIAELVALGASFPREPVSVSAASVEVGTYITGLFKGNSKYLQCNGGTYLRSAYPDLSGDAISSLSQQTGISSSVASNIAINSAYEVAPSIYKVNGKFYKLISGRSTTSGWQNIPILVSSDGIEFSPVSAISMATPITSYSGVFQMDVLIGSGTTLLAFGRMRANNTNYLVQLKSFDDGVTWVFSTVRNSNFSNSPIGNPVLAAAIGNTVIVHVRGDTASTVNYSSNFGASWSSLSDTDAVNTKIVYGLAEDGSRFMIGFSDGSTAYSSASDLTTATWAAVSPPNANARGVLAVVAGKWLMGGISGYVATCTSLGTWVAQSTCTSGMPTANIERILVNDSLIAFGSLGSPGQIFHCENSSTLPAAAAVTASSIANNPNFLTLASVADGHVYIRVRNETLIRSTALTSFSPVQALIEVSSKANFNTINYGVVKKYGMYFYSVGDVGKNKRYMSTDMRNWYTAPEIIATGCGAVVDAGDRLLAIDDNHLIWQSTDGDNWNTTGITRPTLTGTPYSYFARLYVCANGWVYFYRFRTDDTTYQAFVSKNGGATWASLSGFSTLAGASRANTMQNPCLFTELNGKIYSLSVNYVTSSYGYYLYVSSDGINFTSKASFTGLNGVSYVNRNGIFRVNGVIYAYIAGDTTEWLASYDDGVSFIVVPSSFIPPILITMSTSGSSVISDRLSPSGQTFLMQNSGANLNRLTGDALSVSANYAAGSTNVTPVFHYADAALKMVADQDEARIPPVLTLADANTTFTLPNISNTWLRAAA